MANGKGKITQDILEITTRYRRTITDLQSSISDVMSAGKDMIQFIKADPNSKKYGQYLAKILKNIQSMNEMINKIYKNKSMINPEPIYVDKTLEFILNGKKGLPQFSGITIIEEYGAPDIRVVIDRTEFEEIVKHLINNAQEAISGEGRIAVRTSYQAEKKLVRLEIDDNGSGISRSIRPHIFSKYFTSKEGKDGMGLAIVGDILSQYDGTLDAESAGEKKGAVFTVMIPENQDLFDEVKFYQKKFYYSTRVEAFVQKYLLGWNGEKIDLLKAEMCKLDPGFKCLGREQINTLLSRKKDFFLGRKKKDPERMV